MTQIATPLPAAVAAPLSTPVPTPVRKDAARSVEDAKVKLLAWAQRVDDEVEAQAAQDRKSQPIHGMISALGTIVAARVLTKVEKSSHSPMTRVAVQVLRYAIAARLFTPVVKAAISAVKRR
ncbi:MAG TPA: hypothetical protein VK157_17985 [Phycisphaerales bacterium]|nr:hypothetical protein [Phycisphaerales bacterium]